MPVQSNDDCGWGVYDWSYSDNLDLWAELAEQPDAVSASDRRGRPSLHRDPGDTSDSLRAGSQGRSSLRFAIFHTLMGGAGGDCGGRAKETRQTASLRRDGGNLPGARTDSADFLRRGRGQWQQHNTGNGESANGGCFVC